jgi:scyllo-inositol 2-dehydrogenase (NADP+)
LKEGETIREYVPTLPGNYLSFYDGIYKSIVHDEALPVTAQDGIDVMRIIESAFQSSKEKRVVNF